jgi:hypothetical protein
MAGIITSIGSLVTGAISWLGSFVTEITSSGNELLLLFVITPFVGLGIGLIRRIIHS